MKTLSEETSIWKRLKPAAGASKPSDSYRLVTQWTELKTLPPVVVLLLFFLLLLLLRPALVCICKYSISDICSLIIFKSDQDTTAAEAIHKEAHILFLLLFFFVGMELVSTKPTKPTCSYVLNKRLFIYFFCLFLFITVVYDGVQDDKQGERERKKNNQWTKKGNRRKGRIQRERQRKDEK